MQRRFSTTFASVIVAAAVLVPLPATAQLRRDTARIDNRGWENASQNAYDRGLREGLTLGADDGRKGRAFGLDIHVIYRQGDRGYQSRYGSRDAYRDAFRRGFAVGYQDGFQRYRSTVLQNRRGDRPDGNPRVQRGYQEPAYARGFSDGYKHGLEDGRDRDRYDPVGHGDYRDGDQGYHGSYGSRDAYRNNYRSGFRPGYEEGYRDGARRR
jgi:flagellar biosynthesis/type III secretory pathway protein FliH